MGQARTDWEEEMRKKQKDIHRAQKRKARREKLLGKRGGGSGAAAAFGGEDATPGGGKKEKKTPGSSGAASSAEEEEEEISDEDEIARREAEKEFELPPEMMPTLTFGEFVPLRVGRNLPPPRFGHSMCLAGTTSFVFGGRNNSRNDPVLGDFYCFDGAPLVWREIAYDGDSPGSRVSHSMIQLEHYLYVLGGGSGNRSFNDLHRLDLFTMHWELIHTQGEAPGSKPDALIGHSVEWVDPYLVVFAGGDGRRPSNDLHTLELRTATWRSIHCERLGQYGTQGAPPAPRVGHSSTLVGAEMVVIGGFSKGKYFHDVHALQVESLQWSQQVVSGTAPHGRVSHSATLYEGNIHLFGGSAGGVCFNDYFVLDPFAGSSASPSKGTPGGGATPGGGILKGGSSSSSKNKNALVAKADTRHGRSGLWTSPEVSGFAPEPRYSHTATVIGPMLFIVGGLAKKGKPIDDLHVLDLSAMIWSLPRVTLEGPAPRGRHTTASVGSVLFIFGGGAQGELYSDIWALDVDGLGMERLEQLAMKDVAKDASSKLAEKAIPMSFLAPQIGDGLGPDAEYPPHREYEDVEARDADANEVRSWLQHLGLAQHSYTFEAHEIDFEVLLQLQVTAPSSTPSILHSSPQALLTSPPLNLSSPHLSSPHFSSPHFSSPHLSSPHLSCPYPLHLSSPLLTSPLRTLSSPLRSMISSTCVSTTPCSASRSSPASRCCARAAPWRPSAVRRASASSGGATAWARRSTLEAIRPCWPSTARPISRWSSSL